ncbi:MAG: GIY-YIG nuclease family protein [Rhodospirillales bacterium]|nr:GIY-YIG nuclease family protein [Rhodospirillales bacterium]
MKVIQANPRLASLYNQCQQVIDNPASVKWYRSGSKRDAGVKDRQAIYFFRNRRTGSVREGYIGQAGSLANRLGDHFSNNPQGDNLLVRLADEEHYRTGVGPLDPRELRLEASAPLSAPTARSSETTRQ